MVRPCSTISMVIRPYEMRNSTVSSGNQPWLFRVVSSAVGAWTGTALSITVVKAALPWRPEVAGAERIAPGTPSLAVQLNA